MKILAVLFTVAALVSEGDAILADSWCSCPVNHPQEKICRADFGFVGTVHASQESDDVYIYTVQVDRDQIFKGLSYLEDGTETVTVYTPYGTSLCGRPNLLYQETYLFTGGFMEGKYVITYCNWVKAWDDVTELQKEYLRTKEYLNHCSSCKITGVKGALTMDQNNNELVYPSQVSGLWTPYNCYYNPISSVTYRPEDCENSYSFCHPAADDNERCDWKITPEYDQCFTARENSWVKEHSPKAAAALTQWSTVKDCRKLETRRKKKKCLKMVKEHLLSIQMKPRDMLEELLDLRDMWLEDDIFDDDDDE